jgi:hypothetical protein
MGTYFIEVLNNPLFLLTVSSHPALISPNIATSASLLCFKIIVHVSTPAVIAKGLKTAMGKATM